MTGRPPPRLPRLRTALGVLSLTAAFALAVASKDRAAVLAVLEALEELGMVVCEHGAYRLQG